MTSKAALGAMTYPSFSAYRTANLMSPFWTIWAFCILQNTPSLFCICLFCMSKIEYVDIAGVYLRPGIWRLGERCNGCESKGLASCSARSMARKSENEEQ